MKARKVWISPSLKVQEAHLKNQLARNLVSPDAAAELRGYIDDCFRRLLSTLEFVPEGSGRVLELGANPYFLTMLLRRFRRYDLELANFFGGTGENVQRIRDADTGETEEFRYREFNVEQDEFPYPDAHFDGVLYCEILEHLVRDPIAVFAEIHRVLKAGGWLILTTPNAARRQNVMKLTRGKNLYDPYSGHGAYGRHNREYTVGELGELLTNTGFDVERIVTQDLHPCSRGSKLLALALGPASGYNVYAFARRGREFRWYYPPWLFRSGNPTRRVRQPFVRVGLNDAVQIGDGWWDVERWPDGPMRWTHPRADAFLRTNGGERVLRLLACGGPPARGADPEIIVRIDAAGLAAPLTVAGAAPCGAWTWLEFSLPRPLPAGEVKVTLESPAFVPAGASGIGDSRSLGVALREVQVMP